MGGNTTMGNSFSKALHICAFVCLVDPKDVKSKSRLRILVYCRNIFVIILRELFDPEQHKETCLKEIGKFLGDKDHSTLSYNIKTFRDMMAEDSRYYNLYMKAFELAQEIIINGNEELYTEVLKKMSETKYQYHYLKGYKMEQFINYVVGENDKLTFKRHLQKDVKFLDRTILKTEEMLKQLRERKSVLLNKLDAI